MYRIITESSCDISEEQLKAWQVELIRMPYLFQDDGKQKLDHDEEPKAFYQEMRKGRIAPPCKALSLAPFLLIL